MIATIDQATKVHRKKHRAWKTLESKYIHRIKTQAAEICHLKDDNDRLTQMLIGAPEPEIIYRTKEVERLVHVYHPVDIPYYGPVRVTEAHPHYQRWGRELEVDHAEVSWRDGQQEVEVWCKEPGVSQLQAFATHELRKV